jgi:hypothetical protein
MIDVTCSCGTVLRARERDAGRTARCPNCRASVTIPGGSADDAGDVAAPALNVKALLGVLIAVLALAVAGLFFLPSLALGLGLFAFVIPGTIALVALLFALWGLSDSRGGARGGKPLALMGLAGGALALLLLVPLFFVSTGYRNVKQKEEDDRKLAQKKADELRELEDRKNQSANNLRNIILAIHDYEQNNGTLPPAVVYDEKGGPLYSWRVLLLPYIEQAHVYDQFRLNERWDSPHNIKLLAMMPEVYKSPLPGNNKEAFVTPYQVFWGGGSPFAEHLTGKLDPGLLRPFHGGPFGLRQLDPGLTLHTIGDGTSNTIFIAEAAQAVPWSKPADLPVKPGGPLPKLGGLFEGGFHVAMGDGSVRWVSSRVSEATLRAAITCNGNDVLGPDWDED